MRSFRRLIKWLGVGLIVVAIVEQLRLPPGERTWNGRVFDLVPYDLRPPTFERMRSRWWNTEDHRLFVPQVFGVGWTINLARAKELLAGGV